MNPAPERTDEAARRLALLVASASVEVIRIPVMDLLKITDAHRLKALGIQPPKRIRVVRPQPSPKKAQIKIVLEVRMLMVVVEVVTHAVEARTT